MHRFRLFLIVVSGAGLLALAVFATALSSTFQTWIVRRELAARPELGLTVGTVDAGLKRVTLRDVRLARDGSVLVLPLVEADLPVLAAIWDGELRFSRLVARAGILRIKESSGARSAPSPLPPAAPGTLEAFAGLLSPIALPFDLALDGVDLAGTVHLPAAAGEAVFALTGGGLGAGREGAFALAVDTAFKDPKVDVLTLRAKLAVRMETPRRIAHLSVALDAAAGGGSYPAGVKLAGKFTAARSAAGENYTLVLEAPDRLLVDLKAALPAGGSRFDGTWKLDLRDTDLAPFLAGRLLPAFASRGLGTFDTDARFEAPHIAGRIDAAVERLGALSPAFVGVGAVKLGADFDLARRGDTVAVQRLEAVLSEAGPVATVRALQPFAFDLVRGELRAGDPAGELVSAVLHGLPFSWLQPFLPSVALIGGPLRGEIAAVARDGGITLRSRTPWSAERVGLTQGNRLRLRDVDVAFELGAEQTPQGWQVHVAGLDASSRGLPLLRLNAKVGRLAGAARPLQTAGTLTLHMPGVSAQPWARDTLQLAHGAAEVEFAGSVGARQEWLAKVRLSDLAAKADGKTVPLPAVTADLRADVAAGGEISFHAPLVLERDGRRSDLTLAGTLGAATGPTRAVEIQATGELLTLDDAKILAAALPSNPAPEADARPAAPPWAGWHGAVALRLKRVVVSESLAMDNVAGRLRLEAGAVKLETAQLGLGEGGQATVQGALTFDPAAPQPYALAAAVALRAFDPAPWLRSPGAAQPAALEGKFDVTSTLASRAASLGELAPAVSGEMQVTSKGGVFRGLPVNVGNLVENTSRLSGLLASAGSVIGGLTGRKEAVDVANKAQAVGELAQSIAAIRYDQLSVVLTRDTALSTELKEFSLISPELRLTGSGRAVHRPGTTLAEDELEMEFQLRARGRQRDLLGYLGALDPQPDDLGYAATTLPLKIGGTVGHIDATEFSNRLVTLALEKSGFLDRATDWFTKPRSGK